MICRRVQEDKYHVTHLHFWLDHRPWPDGGRTACEPEPSGRPPCPQCRPRRGRPARPAQAEAVLVGDVETIAGAKDIASQANALGRFDAVIDNAAVGY